MAKAAGNSRKSAADMVAHVRSEIAGLLGIDPEKATFAQRLKLDHATGLRLELDRMQSRQLAGEAIDLTRFTNAAAELERLLPAADTSSWDMERLTTDELRIMERIEATENVAWTRAPIRDAQRVYVAIGAWAARRARRGCDAPLMAPVIAYPLAHPWHRVCLRSRCARLVGSWCVDCNNSDRLRGFDIGRRQAR